MKTPDILMLSIFNTDQGSQFSSAAFTGLLLRNEIAISERVTAGMRAAEARGKHIGRPAIPKQIVNEIETLTTSTDLSIRQIQAKTAGRVSRGIVGEITKRARSAPHPACG